MRLVSGFLGILLLAGCGAGSGRFDDGERAAAANAVGEPCSDDGACVVGAVCADTGVRCVRAPCPAWACFVPCVDDAACSGGRCEPEPRDVLRGDPVRVCVP